jgi:hypothetical protein
MANVWGLHAPLSRRGRVPEISRKSGSRPQAHPCTATAMPMPTDRITPGTQQMDSLKRGATAD